MKQFKLTFLLAMLMSMASTAVSAYDFEVDGIYYNYNSDSGGSSVSVTYKNYESNTNEYIGAVNIPESVTYNEKTYNVTSIGSNAFHGRGFLTSVTIGNKVTFIGDNAFDGCGHLSSVTIGNRVTAIGHYAFNHCSSLTSITIPNSVTLIGNSAFAYCSGLTSVTIPNSVTSIGAYAFEGCSSLTSVTIPNSVISINSSFNGCSSLTSIVVDSENTIYDSRENCNAIIKTSTNELIVGCQNTIIPNSVSSIGDGAFWGCIALTSVTIPNSVTSIGNWAFAYCI